MKAWVKFHRLKGEVILAICDENLLDKELNFNGIKIRITKSFYGGELIELDELKKLLGSVTIINAFGKNSIKKLEELGYISSKNVLIVDGIPHAQYAKV